MFMHVYHLKLSLFVYPILEVNNGNKSDSMKKKKKEVIKKGWIIINWSLLDYFVFLLCQVLSCCESCLTI